ncbi:unnamed protein product [Adineta steineri]|uniref:Uncharacterized protein n=1 Tax=Adineta steineri TaxID=433720 RepID=A0A818JL05_9BILA|nr:unnamed protein product [Adineta steineri]CAF3542715.1 unnamed protein product [Adineta steineri]
MESNFFRTRALFWSFWANIIFFFGMIGYLLMDGLDYMRPDTFNASVSSGIYVILAAIFVVDSTFQLLSIWNTNSSTHRYYIMVFSCLCDKIGSYSYFFGALFLATAFTTSKTIWTCNTIGVCGFAIGAASNMMIKGPSIFYTCANIFNLLASLLYVLATFITLSPITQLMVILGDIIYLIDAILYMICWFSDRQSATVQNEQTILITK